MIFSRVPGYDAEASPTEQRVSQSVFDQILVSPKFTVLRARLLLTRTNINYKGNVHYVMLKYIVVCKSRYLNNFVWRPASSVIHIFGFFFSVYSHL